MSIGTWKLMRSMRIIDVPLPHVFVPKGLLLVLLFLVQLEQGQCQLLESRDTIVCPTSTFSTANNINIQTAGNNEISGIAFSLTIQAPSGEPVLYGINDGGNGERLVIWDSGTGQRLRTLRIPNVVNTDWEDLTIGTCGSATAASSSTPVRRATAAPRRWTGRSWKAPPAGA